MLLYLVFKKTNEAHLSPGVVMRLHITRGTFFFFFTYFNYPLTPAQTSLLKQSLAEIPY